MAVSKALRRPCKPYPFMFDNPLVDLRGDYYFFAQISDLSGIGTFPLTKGYASANHANQSIK